MIPMPDERSVKVFLKQMKILDSHTLTHIYYNDECEQPELVYFYGKKTFYTINLRL